MHIKKVSNYMLKICALQTTPADIASDSNTVISYNNVCCHCNNDIGWMTAVIRRG